MKYTTMKIKSTLLLLLLMVLAGNTFAGRFHYQQNNGQNPGDRIESLRIAYISQQLNLTPQEAEKFWPVYNSYRNDLETLRKNFKGADLTAEQQLDLEQKKLDLKKKYKPQFEVALGTEKMNQLYNLERKFQEKLKEIREQRMQQRGANPNARPFGQR